jgi:hypothetical protein
MRIAVATHAARGTDSITSLTVQTAQMFAANGIDFVIRYLGSITPQELSWILTAGLAFMPVTFADVFDGNKAVDQLQTLGIPTGATVWLDLEGIGPSITPATLIQRINAWALEIKAAGYLPGLYCGANGQLTSKELYSLLVVRYWKSLSRVEDRNGQIAEPDCGYSMLQLYPTTSQNGVSVDKNIVCQDYQGRMPTWIVA